MEGWLREGIMVGGIGHSLDDPLRQVEPRHRPPIEHPSRRGAAMLGEVEIDLRDDRLRQRLRRHHRDGRGRRKDIDDHHGRAKLMQTLKDTKVTGAIKRGRVQEEMDQMIDAGISADDILSAVYEKWMEVLRARRAC